MPIGRCLTSSSVMATLSLMMPMHLPEVLRGRFQNATPAHLTPKRLCSLRAPGSYTTCANCPMRPPAILIANT